ncbi:hypothetical protein RhiirC2_714018 [Rhizophagus irregularis]|uniref:Uncharacterized protein n=1 Tax=Rhizophagus irregularis TaxID=588596 RepID=A0A2N1N134_9GLOM|nr:hypothetical protein RhiirC2_714018 [Rhizophagus irregularis]
MFKKNKFTMLLLIFSLMIIERVSMVYSQDTSSGIGSIPEGQTWYICSKGATNFIDYSMRMVETSQDPTPGFGTNVIGNHPKQFNTVGLLTMVANYTNIRALVDPSRPIVLFREELSCNVEPVKECSKSTNPPLSIQDILCLAIMNPNSNTTKFTASISFDQNASKPILTIPPPIDDNPSNTNNSPSSSPTKSTPYIDPTETHSFFVNIANRSKIIDPGYLLLLGSFISIILT